MILYVESKKMAQMNLSTKYRLTDMENRLVVGEGWRERVELRFGIGRFKLLHLEWINKVPLYSTGNYIQYPVINLYRKVCEKKECTFVYN